MIAIASGSFRAKTALETPLRAAEDRALTPEIELLCASTRPPVTVRIDEGNSDQRGRCQNRRSGINSSCAVDGVPSSGAGEIREQNAV